MADYEWILTGRVTGEERREDGVPTGDYLVRGEKGQQAWLSLSADGELLFDGAFVNVGEDLIQYLSVLDEIQDHGSSEPYVDQRYPGQGMGPDDDDPYQYGTGVRRS